MSKTSTLLGRRIVMVEDGQDETPDAASLDPRRVLEVVAAWPCEGYLMLLAAHPDGRMSRMEATDWRVRLLPDNGTPDGMPDGMPRPT